MINIEIITKEQLLKLDDKEKIKVLVDIVNGKKRLEENSKEAKQIALGTWVTGCLDNPFIELRVTRCWNVKGTDYYGELDIKQINELKLSWWSCTNCDNEEFEIVDNEHYKCKNCNYEGEIPYE